MVNAPSVSYQPAVAYQGGQVGTSEQEPKSGQTQPREAPVSDTQPGDNEERRSSQERGGSVDVLA